MGTSINRKTVTIDGEKLVCHSVTEQDSGGDSYEEIESIFRDGVDVTEEMGVFKLSKIEELINVDHLETLAKVEALSAEIIPLNARTPQNMRHAVSLWNQKIRADQNRIREGRA